MSDVARPSSPSSGPRNSLLHWNVRTAAIAFAVWTALALFAMTGYVVRSRYANRSFDFGELFWAQLVNWYSCGIFTPVYLWMARRWPIERGTWKTRVPLWLGATAAIVPLRFVAEDAALDALGLLPERGSVADAIAFGFVPETIAFLSVIAVVLSLAYYERWRARELQTQVLGRQLAEARLEALSAQLQPHFLFNTLQGISTLLHRDPRGADRMIARLSDLLRRSFEHADAPLVPLSEELATLRHYLAIQQIRFEDRLSVVVDSDGASNTPVPHLILQPLVENAIEHGIARHAGAGTVRVSARLERGRLTLSVANDANGSVVAEPRTPGGIGLSNTRARLAALYGDAASLDVSRTDEHGFVVTMTMPAQPPRTAA